MELLSGAGLRPDKVVIPNIDEKQMREEKPTSYVKRMAASKSKSIEIDFGDILITADTIVVFQRQIFHKTYERLLASKYIESLSGKRHVVYTALCLRLNGYFKCHLVKTVLKMRKLESKEINSYLDRDEWQGCSGGYNLKGSAIELFPYISGCFSNVVGLPIPKLKEVLKGMGVC